MSARCPRSLARQKRVVCRIDTLSFVSKKCFQLNTLGSDGAYVLILYSFELQLLVEYRPVQGDDDLIQVVFSRRVVRVQYPTAFTAPDLNATKTAQFDFAAPSLLRHPHLFVASFRGDSVSNQLKLCYQMKAWRSIGSDIEMVECSTKRLRIRPSVAVCNTVASDKSDQTNL